LVVSSDSGVNAQIKHLRPVFNIKQVVRDAPLDFFRRVGLAAPAVAPRGAGLHRMRARPDQRPYVCTRKLVWGGRRVRVAG
jgi:hypothetical protein